MATDINYKFLRSLRSHIEIRVYKLLCPDPSDFPRGVATRDYTIATPSPIALIPTIRR